VRPPWREACDADAAWTGDALRERAKYEQMWAFAAYRDDHATAHAVTALQMFGGAAGDSVLDIGAGAGYASAHLLNAGLRVLAIDIASNAMALLVGNLWDLPPCVIADWGFCCDVMEHIPSDRIEAVLRFIRASTRRSTLSLAKTASDSIRDDSSPVLL
jgi:SAM-dependent methyltransferase